MEKPNSPYSLAIVGEKGEEINHQYKKITWHGETLTLKDMPCLAR
jgi:hypothetical protein